MTKQQNWLDKLPLDIISIVVMVASAFLDGRYLTRYSFDSLILGGIFAYTFNSVADIAVNKLSRSFVRLRLNGKLAKWTRRLTWLLVPFWLASFYFTLVFSWREAALQQPTEPQWLHWSIAAFAPTLLTGLGIAQALQDGKFNLTQNDQQENPSPKQKPQKLQGQALRAAILEERLSNPGITYDELAVKFGSNPSTVGYNVRKLTEAGRLNGQKNAE